MSASLYTAASMKVSIIDAFSNFGYNPNLLPIDFYISARQNGAAFGSPNDGLVAGPVSEYVRLVKM